MAIRGGLSEFSVPEILQLLALQQKSGVLALSNGHGSSHVLFFERGKVLAAAERRLDGRNTFLGYLSRNQLLTQDQLESVEDICRATGHDLFTVLVSSGVLGRDRLQEEMRRYTQLLVDEVVPWRDGTYEFTGDEKSLPAQGIVLKMNPEELLLESMRRNDELATLKESLLAPDLLIARVRGAEPQPLPRECTMVLGLVDGRRTVEEIGKDSPLGEYLALNALSELLSRQQAMIVDPHDAAKIGPVLKEQRRFPVAAGVALVSLVVGSALLGTGLRPLLEKSRGESDWLTEEVQVRRADARDDLQAEVVRLRARLHDPAPEPLADPLTP